MILAEIGDGVFLGKVLWCAIGLFVGWVVIPAPSFVTNFYNKIRGK